MGLVIRSMANGKHHTAADHKTLDDITFEVPSLLQYLARQTIRTENKSVNTFWLSLVIVAIWQAVQMAGNMARFAIFLSV